MERALVTIDEGMLPIMSKLTGGILRPSQLEGENVSSAAGEVRMSYTLGWAASISGVTCLSMRSKYS